ncbi:Putative LOC763778 [Caligus rogercresseyi]|uniref:LOC763778 n=1 Tax=Caligus rogercresseyi TaxID=217165 RepID=A0A7T8KDR6_CALRO|nr:Putative LOC763778 [Caligus rogercresseyi]
MFPALLRNLFFTPVILNFLQLYNKQGIATKEAMNEKIFDAHLHFWDLEARLAYPRPNPSFEWPNESTPGIHKSFLPAEHSDTNFREAILFRP